MLTTPVRFMAQLNKHISIDFVAGIKSLDIISNGGLAKIPLKL